MFKSEKIEKTAETHTSSKTSSESQIADKCSTFNLLNRKKGNIENESISDVKNNLGIKKIYLCDECSNSYMHYSALYSHKKTKHNNTPNYNLKKRLKTNNLPVGNNFKQKRKTPKRYFFNYSLDQDKCGKTNIFDVVSNFSEVLEKIKIFFPKISRVNSSYPLFQKIISGMFNLNLAKTFVFKDKERQTCDEIFSLYLQEISTYINKSYFSRVVLPFFISLREYINENGIKYKLIQMEYGVIDSLNENDDYCAVYTAEDICELCNEFFNYINDEIFYRRLGVKEEEFLDEFMNFNSWLFGENYSCCKIFLVNE